MSLFAGTLLAGAAVGCGAQEGPELLAVGEEAPDIQLVGATRYGTLAEPVRLSDFRGETVVLAFFFRARTPG
jgi:peroxiredoxin Q/BCP